MMRPPEAPHARVVARAFIELRTAGDGSHVAADFLSLLKHLTSRR
jgi:hypothetical protein